MVPTTWFLLPLLSAFAITSVLIPCARRIAKRTGYVSLPRQDRFHTAVTPLLGGPACLIGICAALSLLKLLRPGSASVETLPARFALALAWGIAGLLTIGLVDDRRALRPLVKAAAQGVVMAAALLLWRPHAHLGSPGITLLVWAAGMVLINAWNYLDHADGVFAVNAGAASMILAIGWMHTAAAGPGPSMALTAVGGSLAAFLCWNFPTARIFLGDAGSLPIGFALVFAAAALLDRSGVRDLPVVLAAHSIVLADILLVTASRLHARVSPFRGGCDHSGHRLARFLGRRKPLLLYALLNLLAGGLALRFGPRDPLTVSILFAATSVLLAAALGLLAPGAKSQS